MARGRPKKAGTRRKDGRLAIQPRDYGNAFVQARRAAFEVFQGGKAGDQVSDPIGRAWAVGLLDGTTQDAAILRDIGRRYAKLYEVEYHRTQCATADNEGRVRGTGAGSDEDPMGERFKALDQLARNAGSKQRRAMQKLCVVDNPDANPMWLERQIALAQFGICKAIPMGASRLLESAYLNHDRDRMILTQAVQALVAMVEGK